ncbi:hypothetical protein [Rhodopirellula halodulae]|uniref:hypothetical protein n=1 Tax=Rhodopirellula halodulae TaxID=2894198 RepID=UPI001E649A3A|nr:hypothetical protein [Rhodopirellula sp. JC737]MCC9655052.1 hypothetical protein [Rhodopirellula sp. JC737]
MQLDSSQRFPDQNERKLSWKRWKKHPLRELRMNDAFDAKLIRSCMSVWVRVRKQRQLRTVPLEGQRDADGNHTELQTEWAHVELLGREWWTLCFEVECAIEEHEESNLCRQMIRGVEEAVFDGTSQMSFPSGNIPEFPCQSWPEFIAAQLPSR